MKDELQELIECESFSLHVAPGEYQSFPVVDDRGLFSNFRKTNEDFIFGVEIFLTGDGPVIGIYKKVGCFSILVSASSALGEMNTEANEILSRNESMRKCIEEILNLLALQ